MMACLAFQSINKSHAQEIGQVNYDEIVVMDKLDLPLDKNNRDITVIHAAEIAQMPARSVQDVLSLVSGIDVRQRGVNGAQADISIDGGTFDQLIVLVNGHKMSDPQTGHNMMNIPIPLDAIERIEILRGPAASRYGINGLSGVINIVTKKVKDNEISVSLTVGSNFNKDTIDHKLYSNYGVQVMDSRKINKWEHVAALSYDGSNGYRYNSSYTQTKAMLSSQYAFSDKTQLQLLAGYINNDFDAKDYYAYPRDGESTERVETFVAGLRIPIHLNHTQTITPYLTYRYTYDDYIFIKDKPEVFRNQHHSNVIDAGVDYTFESAIGKNVIGFNTRWEMINSTNLGERQRENWGVFYENYNRLQSIDVRLGVFAHYNSVFGFNVYPQAELGYIIGPLHRLYLNAGLGQRVPTFTDLYYTSPTNMGNDALIPEKSLNVELGYRGQSEHWQYSVGAFHRWGYDMIDWIRKDTTEAWQVYNFSKINTLGLKAQVHFHQQLNTFLLNVKSSYTYLQPNIVNDQDPSKADYMSQYSINALEHHWVNQIKLSYAPYFMLLTHNWLQRYVSDTSIHPDLKKSYHVFNLRLGYQQSQWQMYLQAQNLTSEKYIEAGMVTMPQLWMSLGVQYRFH